MSNLDQWLGERSEVEWPVITSTTDLSTFSKRRLRPTPRTEYLTKVILEDPAVKSYVEFLKSKPKNGGILKKSTRYTTLVAVEAFLQFMGSEITSNSFSNLVDHKRNHPNDRTIEEKLRAFSNIEDKQHTLRMQRRKSVAILGIFRANATPLQMKIDFHFPSRQEDCTETILLEIYSLLTPEQQLMMQWQAYAGERAEAIYNVPLQDIEISDERYVFVNIKNIRSKTGFAHPCIVPADLARQVLTSAVSASRETPFPNYESQWTKITKFSMEKYGVHLHSHYLRKRFQSIAEQTSMPHNHYSILMGERPKEGHDPSVYSLASQKLVMGEQLIKEYET